MAYLDLSLAGAVQEGTAAPVPLAPVLELDPAERAAVLLSLRESRHAIKVANISRRAAHAMLQLPDEQVFASERLEAIRRYSARYRIEGTALAAADDQTLRNAGVSALEAVALRAFVDGASTAAQRHPRPRSISALLGWLILAAVPATAAAALYAWLATQLEDRLGALILSIILVMGIVSPVALAGHPTTRSA